MNSITIFKNHVAAAIGIEKAIILCQLEYWIDKNKANDVHFHNGKWWTYNSAKAWEQMLGGIMNERKIARILKALCDEGFIEISNFNKTSMDRTLWYAITQKGYALLENDAHFEKEKDAEEAENEGAATDSENGANTAESVANDAENADFAAESPICQNCLMHSSNLENAFVKNGKCIRQNCQMHSSELSNPFVKNGGAIPKYTQNIHSNKHSNNTKESKPQRFRPPSKEEVTEYCRAKGYTKVNPEAFVNFYASKNWMVGKTKMSNWHAAVAGWNAREKEKTKSVSKNSSKQKGSKASYDLSKYGSIGLHLKNESMKEK